MAHHFYTNALPGGFLGVDIFFVISGYVITASLLREPTGSIKNLLIDFYCRRVKRLLPALILCVLVTAVVGTAFVSPEAAEFTHSIKAGFFSLFGLSNMYFYREAMDYFGTSAQFNLFTHTWSLGVEEQFYAIFPALLWIGFNVRGFRGAQLLPAALGLLVVVSFTLFILLDKTGGVGPYFLMPPRFWELGIGCLAAVSRPDSASPVCARFEWASWAAFLFLGIVLFSNLDQLYAGPCVAICTVVLILTAQSNKALYRWLTTRSVVAVGLISYSLYLWHWSILSLGRWTLGAVW
jgi:peptidoglycan/LPS O-acetylase OafA/YrhL